MLLPIIQAAIELATAIIKANQWRLDHLTDAQAAAEAARDSAPLNAIADWFASILPMLPKAPAMTTTTTVK